MALKQDLLSEKIAALPLREPLTVRPDQSVGQVVRKMREAGLGVAIVVDEQQKPLGKFTERQLIGLLLDGSRSLDQPVSRCMASVWEIVHRDDPIARVADRMHELDLRFLIVTDSNGHVVGVTGQRGLIEYIVDQFPRAVWTSRLGSHPYIEQREGA